MKESKGYYSLIQYCPDLGRLEAANVGVLLFCPERHFLKALTSRSNRRIIHFFGSAGHDWARINAFKKGLQDRIAREGAEIQSVEQLERFIAQRANLLQITPPRPMKVVDPEKDLEELLNELTGERRHAASKSSFRRFLAKQLERAPIERKLCKNIRVRVPVLEKEIQVPFAFQNGRCNLIDPVRFGTRNPDQNVVSACKYAVEGRALYDHPDPRLGPLQLVVVAKFRPRDAESPARVKTLFEQYDVRLIQIPEIAQLIEEIRTTGKDVDGVSWSGTIPT